jgi:hypothetical protein
MVVANNVRCAAWKSRTGLKEIVRYTNTVNRNRRARTAMNFALPEHALPDRRLAPRDGEDTACSLNEIECQSAPNAHIEAKSFFGLLPNIMERPPPVSERISPATWENREAHKNDQLANSITDENNLVDSNKQARACENCGKSFEPRTGNGGKAQKFCTPTCRRQFHGGDTSNNLHQPGQSQRPAPNVPTSVTTSTPQIEDTNFDWDKDKNSIALESQDRTAIYCNPSGHLVIRQERWPDDDSYIVICKNNIAEFLDRLTDACGILSFP